MSTEPERPDHRPDDITTDTPLDTPLDAAPDAADEEPAEDEAVDMDDMDDTDDTDGAGGDEATLRVGQAVPEQAAAILRVLQASFAEQAHLDPPAGVLDETEDDIRAAIESGQTVVALLDGEPVGTVRYVVMPDSVYLGRLAVLPEHRRKGVASALLEWCAMVLLPAEGHRAIDVEVRAALPGNLRLFQGLGFSQIGKYPHPKNAKATVIKFRWRAPATGWPPVDRA